MPATDSILKPILGFREEYNELSNFELIAVNLDGITYLSVEHAYQAAKTLDPRQRDQTHMAIFPGVAKKIGSPKGYKRFRITQRADWDSVKLQVIEDLLRQKSRDEEMRAILVKSWPREIIEVNWQGDMFWGVPKGVGENHLGRLLRQIRQEIISQVERKRHA